MPTKGLTPPSSCWHIACWDYLTCYQFNTAAHGPMQAAQFNAVKHQLGGILDRDDPANPFKDWSFVFVPYCTGDLHAGSAITTYTNNSDTHDHHHVGHTNIRAYLARLLATFPSLDRFALTGASAGGYGALFNYAIFRDTLAPAESLLIDDSAPPLEGDAVPEFERIAWAASWGYTDLLTRLCGPTCKDDLSLGLPALAARYPSDRLSLLSSLQDRTISQYVFADGPTFEGHLRHLAATVIAPLASMRVFFIAGSSHTMLGDPAAVPGLWDWLAAQASGTDWTSVIPPEN